MNPPRVLVAGIGNIFLGDDAFGVEVSQKLLRRPQPDGIRVEDFGIRGLDLTYALADGPEYAILIDAVPRGEAPGTLYILEPQLDDPQMNSAPGPSIEAHSMHPLKVLQTVVAMGAGRPGRVLIVGCEPTPFDEDDQQMEMSPPVRAAVDEAVEMVESLIGRILCGELDCISTTVSQPSRAQPASHAMEVSQ
jgi:hydrogenase maturation protease